MRRGVTLIELIIVIVVLGVLATFTIPTFTRIRERTYDREAVANLELIHHAQEIFRMETGGYYDAPGSGSTEDIANINENLRLNLNERVWQYWINSIDGGSTYGAYAERNETEAPGGSSRYWTVHPGDEGPCCDNLVGGDTCPAESLCSGDFGDYDS